eukprot:SAG22_NODE_1945_length_3279_cov_1.768239_1_plen_133_part_00
MKIFSPGMFNLQMRYYPTPSSTPPEGQLRIGAHADSNGFTIVRTDGRPGLELRLDGPANAAAVGGGGGRPDGAEQDEQEGEGGSGRAERVWVPVGAEVGVGGAAPDELVINTGRMIERWTGGHFKAAVHRVV